MALIVLCSGQGLQYPGMLDSLHHEAAARPAMKALRHAVGLGPENLERAQIFDNALAQPLLCASAAGAWAALEPLLPAPLLFAGYSVGELAAYGCAGALDVETLLSLATARATAMDGACGQPQAMLGGRGANEGLLQTVAASTGIETAIVVGADHHVLGGTRDSVEAAEASLAERPSVQLKRLAVSVASHTPLLEPAVAPWRRALEGAHWRAWSVPVLAGLTGQPVRDRSAAIEALAPQPARTLRWDLCIEAMLAAGGRVFLEIGAGNALVKMLQEAAPDVAARAFQDFRGAEGAAAWVKRELARL